MSNYYGHNNLTGLKNRVTITLQDAYVSDIELVAKGDFEVCFDTSRGNLVEKVWFFYSSWRICTKF